MKLKITLLSGIVVIGELLPNPTPKSPLQKGSAAPLERTTLEVNRPYTQKLYDSWNDVKKFVETDEDCPFIDRQKKVRWLKEGFKIIACRPKTIVTIFNETIKIKEIL
jgi:hypothetical protein